MVVSVGGLQPATAASGVPRAFGHTTFSASSNTVVRFRLDQPSTFHLDAMREIHEIDIKGSGRITGVVIAQEGVNADTGAVVYAFHINGCWTAGCRTAGDDLVFPQWMSGGFRTTTNVANDDGSRTITVPAGAYKAYLVTDGAPLTASVAFSGATGRGRLTRSGPADATVTTAYSALADQPAATQLLYSAGATATISSSLGIMVGAMEARSTMHASTANGVCYYLDGRPPGGLFAPGCVGGAPSGLIVLNGVTPMHQGWEHVILTRMPGAWTQGVFLDGAHVPSAMSPSALLWLSLT
jgi:hypothetical protein